MAKKEFSENDIPDLKGYVMIVTGNSGIGFQTALQLALHGARVYIASRSQDRVNEAIKQMNQLAKGAKPDLHYLQIDLLDLKAVASAAQKFMSLESRLDVLINNAGVMTTPYSLTTDGFERQWQTNYLAPHAFTVSLMPLLLSTAASCGSKGRVRVINVSSDAAFIGPKTIQWDDVNMTSTKGMLELCIRDAKSINDRYSVQGVTAYSVHPGIAKSNLQAHDPTFLGTVIRVAVKLGAGDTPLHAALNSLYCATSPAAPTVGAGKFFKPVAKLEPRVDAWLEDTEGNERLWRLGEEEMRSSGLS
ncbi:hypothetical protein B7463_g11664, partial [Scytalidium lignicola]